MRLPDPDETDIIPRTVPLEYLPSDIEKDIDPLPVIGRTTTEYHPVRNGKPQLLPERLAGPWNIPDKRIPRIHSLRTNDASRPIETKDGEKTQILVPNLRSGLNETFQRIEPFFANNQLRKLVDEIDASESPGLESGIHDR